MATGHYIGLDNTGIKLIRAVSSSVGSADADKIPRLDATGKLDISLLPSSASGGVEARDNNNVVLGTATTLRAGTNIRFELSGGTLTIKSLLSEASFVFDPQPRQDIYHAFPSWIPL